MVMVVRMRGAIGMIMRMSVSVPMLVPMLVRVPMSVRMPAMLRQMTTLAGPSGLRCLLVVLAQQVMAIVVAIGRTHNGVNMKRLRFCIGEIHPRMMIKFDQQHRALHPVVKGAVFSRTAHPAKVRGVQMALDIGHAMGQRAGGQWRYIGLNEVKQ